MNSKQFLVKIEGELHDVDLLILQLQELKTIFHKIKKINKDMENIEFKIEVKEGSIDISSVMEVVEFMNNYHESIVFAGIMLKEVFTSVFGFLKAISLMKEEDKKFKIVGEGIDGEIGQYYIISSDATKHSFKISKTAFEIIENDKFSKTLKKLHSLAAQENKSITYYSNNDDGFNTITSSESDSIASNESISMMFKDDEYDEIEDNDARITFHRYSYAQSDIQKALLDAEYKGNKINKVIFSDEVKKEYVPGIYDYEEITYPYVKARIRYRTEKVKGLRPGTSSEMKTTIIIDEVFRYCRPDKPRKEVKDIGEEN